MTCPSISPSTLFDFCAAGGAAGIDAMSLLHLTDTSKLRCPYRRMKEWKMHHQTEGELPWCNMLSGPGVGNCADSIYYGSYLIANYSIPAHFISRRAKALPPFLDGLRLKKSNLRFFRTSSRIFHSEIRQLSR